MAQENKPRPAEDTKRMQRPLALFTLIPFPLCVILEVLLATIFLIIPNAGNLPGWILEVLKALCCAPYLGSVLLAVAGEILGLTLWKSSRTVWIHILLWLNPILLGLHLILIGYIFYALTYTNPFTF